MPYFDESLQDLPEGVHIAHSARIDRDEETYGVLEFDGQTFPWALTDEPEVEPFGIPGVSTVTVTIVVDGPVTRYGEEVQS